MADRDSALKLIAAIPEPPGGTQLRLPAMA